MSLYTRIRTHYQPYWRPKPDELKHANKSDDETSPPEDFQPGLSFSNILLLVKGKISLDDIFDSDDEDDDEEEITSENVKQKTKELLKQSRSQAKRDGDTVAVEKREPQQQQKEARPVAQQRDAGRPAHATKQAQSAAKRQSQKNTKSWKDYNEKDLIMFSDMKPAQKKQIAQLTQQRDNELYSSKMQVMNAPFRLDKIDLRKQSPKINKIWSYHDETCHQIIAHALPGGRERTSQRDEIARARLKPAFRTTKNTRKDEAKYDRTHLIPYDFIDTEDDYRLVVPFSAKLNRGKIAEFENKISNMNIEMYWCTFISNQPWGARWITKVYDKDFNLVDTLQADWGAPNRRVILKWGLR